MSCYIYQQGLVFLAAVPKLKQAASCFQSNPLAYISESIQGRSRAVPKNGITVSNLAILDGKIGMAGKSNQPYATTISMKGLAPCL